MTTKRQGYTHARATRSDGQRMAWLERIAPGETGCYGSLVGQGNKPCAELGLRAHPW